MTNRRRGRVVPLSRAYSPDFSPRSRTWLRGFHIVLRDHGERTCTDLTPYFVADTLLARSSELFFLLPDKGVEREVRTLFWPWYGKSETKKTYGKNLTTRS